MTMDYCDNETWSRLLPEEFPSSSKTLSQFTQFFQIVTFIGCLISLFLNLFIVIVGNLKISRKTPTLRLSLNLAATDGIASFMSGLGIFIASYLPIHHRVFTHQCYLLIIELVRGSALVASVLHLLSLAFLHYIGIVYPLTYRLRKFYSINYFSAACWFIPVTFFSIYYSSIPCQGFRSQNCDILFFLTKKFRITVFIFFLIPLILMLLSYLKIFLILRRRQDSMEEVENSIQNSNNNDKKKGFLECLKHKQWLNFVRCGHKSGSGVSDVSTESMKQADTINESKSRVRLADDTPGQENSGNEIEKIIEKGNLKIQTKINNGISRKTSITGVSFNNKKVNESMSIGNGSISFGENEDVHDGGDISKEMDQSDHFDKFNGGIQSAETSIFTLRDSGSSFDSDGQNTNPIINKGSWLRNKRFFRSKMSNNSTSSNVSSSSIPKRNRKAFTTSLIIVGTYLIGWMPAMLYFVLSCADGCPYSFLLQPNVVRNIVSLIITNLIIWKAIVDPFIYILRMREMKEATKKIFQR